MMDSTGEYDPTLPLDLNGSRYGIVIMVLVISYTTMRRVSE